MADLQTLRVGDLCRRLHVPYRHVRYVLEENLLPLGVDSDPARGHHRELTPAQAFWLGIVLRLKASGVAAPRAAHIAAVTQSLFIKLDTTRHDPNFAPFAGRLQAKLNWFMEIGDLQWFRILAERDKPLERVVPGEWVSWSGEVPKGQGPPPVVSVRVNLTRLAQLLCTDSQSGDASGSGQN